MELLADFELTLSEDDVLRGEGTDPEVVRTRRPSLVKSASAALHQGLTIVHPAAIVQNAKIVEHRHERILLQDGNELVSPLVARHLAGADEVVLVVCTIGSQMEKLASSWMEENPLLGLALDGLGNAAVEKVAQQICRRIGEQAQASDLTVSTPLSPGEPEWPVEVGQPQIFTMLDASQAGVSLTSGGMMFPKKSISFVLGIGQEMTQTDLCELCSLRERCHYRYV